MHGQVPPLVSAIQLPPVFPLDSSLKAHPAQRVRILPVIPTRQQGLPHTILPPLTQGKNAGKSAVGVSNPASRTQPVETPFPSSARNAKSPPRGRAGRTTIGTLTPDRAAPSGVRENWGTHRVRGNDRGIRTFQESAPPWTFDPAGQQETSSGSQD